jgi:hypothetical protein
MTKPKIVGINQRAEEYEYVRFQGEKRGVDCTIALLFI